MAVATHREEEACGPPSLPHRGSSTSPISTAMATASAYTKAAFKKARSGLGSNCPEAFCPCMRVTTSTRALAGSPPSPPAGQGLRGDFRRTTGVRPLHAQPAATPAAALTATAASSGIDPALSIPASAWRTSAGTRQIWTIEDLSVAKKLRSDSRCYPLGQKCSKAPKHPGLDKNDGSG